MLTREIIAQNAKVFLDGNLWCALVGENLMSGYYAFGSTADEALSTLLKQHCGETTC